MKKIPPWLTLLILAPLLGELVSGNGGAWNDRHRLAWVSGGLGFFIFLGFANDAERFTGRSCVSAIAIVGLVLIGLWINRRAQRNLPGADAQSVQSG